MSSVRFRAVSRVVAWLFIAWVGVDLGFPGLCALDQEGLPSATASALQVASTSSDGLPTTPVHVDDCFCCSHCVDTYTGAALPALTHATVATPFPIAAAAFHAGYPPYHPPRA